MVEVDQVALQRARSALDYHLEGHSFPEVQHKFGFYSVEEASFAVQAAALERQKSRELVELSTIVVDANRERARQIEQCEKVAREAWRGYRRSCKDKVTIKVKTVTNKETGDVEEHKEETRTGQAGSPAFLKIVVDAMKRQADLGALDLSLTRKPSMAVNLNVAAELTDEQLLAIAAQAFDGRRRPRAIEAKASSKEPA